MPDTIGRLHPPRLAGAPASPAQGEMYYDTGANILYWWNGSAWVSATGGGGGGGAGHTIQNQGASLPARTNLNFRGAGVTTVDNSAANSSDVTIPALALAARAWRSAALTGISGNTKIPVDTVDYDTGGMFQAANGRMVAPVAGVYQIDGQIMLGTVAANTNLVAEAMIYVNGAQRTNGSRASNADSQGYAGSVVSDSLRLNAGDYVELFAYNTPAISAYTTGAPSQWNTLTMALVSSISGTAAPVTQARAYRSAAFTTVSGSVAVLPIDTISSDPAANVSLAGNRYVCPATGWYQVNAGIYLGTATGANQILQPVILKNGTVVSNGSQCNSTASGMSMLAEDSDIISCNAGDYIQAGYYTNVPAQSAPTTTAQAQTNYLSVTMVGQTTQLASGLTSGTVAARAYRNAAFTLTGGAQKIPLDAINYDTSGLVQTANGRIQIQTAGYYKIDAEVMAGSMTSGSMQIYVNRNGVEGSEGNIIASGSGGTGAVLADTLLLNAGDYLELYVWTPGGTSQSLSSTPWRNFLAVSLVSSIAGGVAPVTQARAYRSAALTLAANTNTKVPVDTTSYDPGANISTANGRYVCPATGYYNVTGQVRIQSAVAGEGLWAVICKNGVQVSENYASPASGGAYPAAIVTDVIQCNAGDYLELWGLNTSAKSLYVATSSDNYLSVSMVGNTGQFAGQSLNTAARMYRNAALTLTAGGGNYKIPLDTVSYDTGGNCQIANSRYIVPTSGYYQVNGKVAVYPTGGANTNVTEQAFIYVNGALRVQGTRVGQTDTYGAADVTANDVLALSAGDYVELYYYSSGAWTLQVGTASVYLSVVKVDMGGAAGAGWKQYNGSGIPTIAGNNGDFAVRQADGEVFQMVSGVWTDQGWSLAGANLNATCAARAYRNAALTIAASTTAKLPVDTVAFDPGGHFQIANSRYICPVAGFYEVSSEVFTNTSSGQGYGFLMIYRNGAEVSQTMIPQAATATGYIGAAVTDVIQCNAGDYIEAWVNNLNGPMTIQTAFWTNFLSVSLVAATAVQQQPLQPASQARAYRAAAFTPSASTWTKVPVDTVSFDASGGAMQAATGRYVCPTSGYYQVDGQLYTSASASGQMSIAGIYKNGVLVSDGVATKAVASGDLLQPVVSDVIQCNAGDYLELWTYGAAVALVVGSSYANYFSVSLIGTAPIAAPSYAARAYRNAAYTPPANTYTKIPVDTVSFDPSGCIQIANSRYVCPVAGVYAVDAEFGSSASATGTYTNVLVAIYKNGAMVSRAYSQPAVANYYGAAVSDKVQCNAGDYIELWCYSGQGTALDVGIPITENFLSVSLLTQAPAPLPVTTPLVSSSGLPSNPVDGQEFYFVADQTSGVVWHLKYRAASTSTHKWELVGGSDMQAGPSGSTGTSSTSAVALSGGPTITVPLPGDYDVTWGCFGQVTVSAQVNLQTAVGVNGALPTGWVAAQSVATALWGGGDMVREQVFANLTASQVLSLMVWNNAANSANYANGWIKAKPRRVG